MNFPAHIERLLGKGIITVAAKHNLREIAAEIGVDKRIDPNRISHNYILHGPDTAAGVAALRKSLLNEAGIKKLRADAVQGLEVLFTWPFPDKDCPRQYFEDCTAWAADHFQVLILSSIVHLDESRPHCHVLMLPLIDGRMNGSNLFGNSPRLAMHLNSFYRVVGMKYEIVRPPTVARLSSTARDFVISQAQSILHAVSGLTEQTVKVLLEPHRKNPHALLEHFKIALETRTPVRRPNFVEIMTRKVTPEKQRYPLAGLRPSCALI